MAIKRNTCYETAQNIIQYLSVNSLTRNVIKPDSLKGSLPNYSVDEDLMLDDISLLIPGYKKTEVVSGSHIVSHSMVHDFWLPTWEFNLRYKNPTLQSDIDNAMFDKMKLDFLKKEETIFIDFIKQVMFNTNRHIVYGTVEEAVEAIKDIKYKKIWAGKGMEVDLPDLQDIRSPNLNGFILTHRSDPGEIGIFAIRQEPCILQTCKNDEIVIFEEQSMMVINKEITYIEVEK